MKYGTQCNVKSEVFNCLTNIVIYSFIWSIEHFEIIAHLLKIIIDIDRYIDIDIDRYRYKYINIHYGPNKTVTQNEFTITWSS